MSAATDQHYLKHEQYQDASNLNARIKLHQRFGTGKIGWHCWVFDQFTLPSDARVLELGCGPGQLWVQNLDRIPAGWRVTLSDFSAGMVEQARSNLSKSVLPFAFEQFDAQEIPFADGNFDAVVANHMLYHVPDRQRTYAEVQRVLKPGGLFYAATNSRDTMRQITDLESRLGIMGSLRAFAASADFFLENGGAELEAWFPRVTLRRQEEALLVTEAQPLIDYILSGADKASLTDENLDRLQDIVKAEIRDNGMFRIDKVTGLFIAEKGCPEFGEREPGQQYAPRPGSYAVLRDAEGRVAVMQTPRGCYLPGGGAEGSETPEETLVREVREECGFEASIIKRLGEAVEYVHTAGNDVGIRKECVFFQVTVADSGCVQAEADHILLWLTLEEAEVRLAHGSQRWIVAQTNASERQHPAQEQGVTVLGSPSLLRRVVAEQYSGSPVAVALHEHREDRDALLAALTASLHADPRVRAAWLWGSFGRDDSDDLSDLDPWIIVSDESAGGMGASLRHYAQRTGSFITGGESPRNAPPGGGFFSSLHEGRHGLLHVDCYWQRQSALEEVPERAVLFNRLDEPPADVSERPTPSEEPAALTDQEDRIVDGIGFGWLMLSIAAKTLARDPGSDMALMTYPRSGLEDAAVLLGMEESLAPSDWSVPENPLSKVERLRHLAGITAKLTGAVNNRGLAISPRNAVCLLRYLDMVEGLLK